MPDRFLEDINPDLETYASHLNMARLALRAYKKGKNLKFISQAKSHIEAAKQNSYHRESDTNKWDVFFAQLETELVK